MAGFSYRCNEGHECRHTDLYCPECGLPVSPARSPQTSEAQPGPTATGPRGDIRVETCPVGHPATAFDIYCSECGLELRKVEREIRPPFPKPPPVATCLAGHSVYSTDVVCPVCGLGIIRPTSSSSDPRGKWSPTTASSPGDPRTQEPRRPGSSQLSRTPIRTRTIDFMKDYWGFGILLAVVLAFIFSAIYLNSVKGY